MADFLDVFRNELLRHEKSPNTVRAYYVQDIRELISWFTNTLGGFSPQQVTAVDIQEFRGYLYNVKNNKPATVNRKLAAIEHFFDIMAAAGIIENNPASGVKMIRYQKQSQVMALEAKELYRLKRMFYLEGNKRDIAIFELMINTGLHEAEVCNLRLVDVIISEKKEM